MKILVVDTYHPGFLRGVYDDSSFDLGGLEYKDQMAYLMSQTFGTSDFYSANLRAYGHEAMDLIVNAPELQSSWAHFHGFSTQNLYLKIPPKLYQVPVLGFMASKIPGLLDIALEQINAYAPDVLYCQDLRFFPPSILRKLKTRTRLIVGQIACALPPKRFLTEYDLILTSFPHFVPILRNMGISSEYFKIGFDPVVLDRLGTVAKKTEVSFVGGISRHHRGAIDLLEYLAGRIPISYYGYGAKSLPGTSPILAKHYGEVWGLNMYRTIAASKITINRHIGAAKNNANNMRLFEATGVGTLLLTDAKDNLGELFEIGKEVIAYSTKEEAVELVEYYLAHPDEASTIAQAGQQRTLSEHTYQSRMGELIMLLHKYKGS